jgi:paraquat-inducible protein A
MPLPLLSAANWVAHVLLALGLTAPCMTVTPRLEPLGRLARWLDLVREPERYSIAEGTLRLLQGGNVAIGVVLLVFSILFPIAKLAVLRLGIAELAAGRAPGRAHRLVQRLAKYSMVDVFVIALVVVASKTFPGGTVITVDWGTYAFAAAALLSVGVAAGVSRRAN